jgi:predicted Ser/Thr protein kinase
MTEPITTIAGPGVQTAPAKELGRVSVDDLKCVVEDRFVLDYMLGSGAFGSVYRATDKFLKMRFAIKFLLNDQVSESGEVFRNEVTAGLSLSHPNIVKVSGYSARNGIPYIIMEYVEGSNLHKMRNSRYQHVLSEVEVRKIGVDACRGLEHAHNKGIVHRDVKPSNILIDSTGVSKIADFGIALIKSNATTGPLAGTPEYMSPEQREGTALDFRTDIYSLGMVLWECLTNGDAHYIGSLSAGMNEIIRRCLAKNPELRWQSAAEIEEELQRLELKGEEGSEDTRHGVVLGYLVIDGLRQQSRYALTNVHRQIFIGRVHDRCDIVLNDPAVSRIHAMVRQERGRFFVQDVGSVNGTYLNKAAIPTGKGRMLFDGDSVHLGSTQIKFEAAGEATKALRERKNAN